jgi:hypothetical protein
MPILWRRISIISRFAGGSRFWPLKSHLAGRRLDQARHAADQRRLAGAREPHDDEDLALGTSRLASRTAPTRCRRPSAAWSGRRGRQSPGRFRGPKSFQTLRQASLTFGIGHPTGKEPARCGRRTAGRHSTPPDDHDPRVLDPSRPARLVGAHPGGDHLLDLLAVEVDLGDHRVHLVVVDGEGLDRLVGARPLVLHAGPADLPDRAEGLAAVIGVVGVDAPLRSS